MSTDKKNEVNSVWLNQDLTKDYTLGWYAYGFSINTSIHPAKFPAIKQAIESALNDTVVEDKGDGIDEITKLKNELKVTEELLNDRQRLLDAIPECPVHGKCIPYALEWIEKYKQDPSYTKCQVDAIRADEFAKGYYSAKEQVTDCLNLNSNDTGKEDNETKSANWRSENLSKQSAPEPSALPNKEWEIIQFYYNNGKDNYSTLNSAGSYYVQGNFLTLEEMLTTSWAIHSVRRLLPDMEVFSCKDNTNKGVIESFVIITEENRQTAVTAHLDKRENIGKIAVKVSGSLGAAHPNQLLEDLEKLPPTPTQPVEDKPVLFTTEDNQPVYMGETYWKVTILDQCWKSDKTIMREETSKPPSYFKYFSTPEAAEQYILENKPCLSVKEINECIHSASLVNISDRCVRSDLQRLLNKKAKQKLNK